MLIIDLKPQALSKVGLLPTFRHVRLFSIKKSLINSPQLFVFAQFQTVLWALELVPMIISQSPHFSMSSLSSGGKSRIS